MKTLDIHILFSVLSYSVLFISFILSFILSYQQKHFKNKDLTSLINKLPSLQSIENILFISIAIGFILLTTSLISGIFFIEDFFAQHLAHKAFFTIFAWIVLLALIFARIKFGLRDRYAIKSVQIAFLILIVGYFGSKFVLEVLLIK